MLEQPFFFSCSFIWLDHSQMRKTQLCEVYQGQIRPCLFCYNLKLFARNYQAREEHSASRGNGDLVRLLWLFCLSASCASQALTHNQLSVPVKILLLDFFESTCEAKIHATLPYAAWIFQFIFSNEIAERLGEFLVLSDSFHPFCYILDIAPR